MSRNDYRRSLPAGVPLPPDDGSNGVGRISCWYTVQSDSHEAKLRHTFEFVHGLDEDAAEMDECIISFVVDTLRHQHPDLYHDEERQPAAQSIAEFLLTSRRLLDSIETTLRKRNVPRDKVLSPAFEDILDKLIDLDLCLGDGECPFCGKMHEPGECGKEAEK